MDWPAPGSGDPGPRWRRAILLGALVVLAACAPDAEAILVLELRTDLKAGSEYRHAEAEVAGFTLRAEEAASAEGSGGLRSIRLGEMAMTPSVVTAQVRLLDDAGRVVARNRQRRQLHPGINVMRLHVTRSCVSADCVACRNGVCVEPECGPESPEACRDPEVLCRGDADCVPTSPCAVPYCVDGSCFEHSAGRCGSGLECTPEGCAARPRSHTLQLRLTRAGDRVVSEPAGIDCPGTCSAVFPAGAEVRLERVERAPDAVFLGWGRAPSCGAREACALRLDRDLEVVVASAPATLAWEPVEAEAIEAGLGGQLSDMIVGAEGEVYRVHGDRDLVTVTWPDAGRLERFAGGLGRGSTDGPLDEAQLIYPRGLVREGETLWLVQQGGEVRELRDGHLTTHARHSETRRLGDLARTGAGALWLADHGGDRVWLADGSGSPPAIVWEGLDAVSVALAGGSVWVADRWGCRVGVGARGAPLAWLGEHGECVSLDGPEPRFDQPSHLAEDGFGGLLVTQPEAAVALRHVSVEGVVRSFREASPVAPRAVAVDVERGWLYGSRGDALFRAPWPAL